MPRAGTTSKTWMPSRVYCSIAITEENTSLGACRARRSSSWCSHGPRCDKSEVRATPTRLLKRFMTHPFLRRGACPIFQVEVTGGDPNLQPEFVTVGHNDIVRVIPWFCIEVSIIVPPRDLSPPDHAHLCGFFRSAVAPWTANALL